MKGVVILFCLAVCFDVVVGQIGVTVCTDGGGECDVFPFAICDTANSLVCVCSAARGFIVGPDNDRCLYECDPDITIDNGVVTVTQEADAFEAQYSCNTGFGLNGNALVMCDNANRAWGTLPTCDAGVIGGPCDSNDVCANIPNSACTDSTCQCLAGYQDDTTGGNCVDINECNSNPCQNGATCSNLLDAYSCTCVIGYEGTNCETNPDNCDPNPCENGGKCTDGLATYTCECDTGYNGNNCENDIDECLTAVCYNGGTCVDNTGLYTCTCAEGFEGLDCSTNIDDCVGHGCQNGATCVDGVLTHTCNCLAGFTDANCATDIDDCENVNCQNGGTCIDGVTVYTCSCADGYAGTHCETDINHCETNGCSNGATCVDGLTDYTCNCLAGYTGQYCQTDINECDTDPCLNGGTCGNLVNDYSCECMPGYTGKSCQTDINDCNPDPCVNGDCTDLVDDYLCTCDVGFTSKNCDDDINDCVNHQCEYGAECVDQVNNYACTCTTGYTGTHCGANINDCAIEPCKNGATCVDLVADYRCDCVPGYTGADCATDINECLEGNTCANGATCQDEINNITCVCAPGFTGDLCQTDVDECEPNPCMNGATCTNNINSFTCSCVTGFTGNLCQTDINECNPNPCQNGGSCNDEVNGYQCLCTPGYEGNECVTDIDECASNPCQNGNCDDHVNSYSCTCFAGYTGVDCEIDINECENFPCQNGGSCTDMVNDFMCTCAAGYTDKICSTDIDDCAGNECQNGATCEDQITKYICKCLPGYNGTFCENDIDECANHVCQNGATCKDLINSYNCTCAPGYDGEYCSNDIKECDSNPCQNNGICNDAVNDYVCDCVAGYTGKDCVPGVLGNDCSMRADICDNIVNGECGAISEVCECSAGYTNSPPSTCIPVDCGTIATPIDGAVDHSEGTVYPNQAYFSCDDGFTLTGVLSVTCQTDGSWSDVPPTCVIKDCGIVQDIDNGAVTYVPNTQYQGKAEFLCDIGYTLVGVNFRTCTDIAVWSDSNPTCQINDCGPLLAPTNGEVDQTSGTTYLSVAQFTCNTGYDMIGEPTLTCQATSTWSNNRPTCKIKDCGIPPSPSNGNVDYPDGTEYGAAITYSCAVGYDLVGESTRTCLASGTWSKTEPACNRKDCGVLSKPENGNIDQTGTLFEDTVTYSCSAGFELNSIATRTCQGDGTWSAVDPACERISCGNLKAPTNGKVEFSNGNLFESVAAFECDAGYTLTGDLERDCLADGTWSNASPTCVIKDCGPLTDPEFGHVLTVFGTTYNQVAQYTCDKGYQISGISERTCLETGIWGASAPTCVILDCGPVANLSNGMTQFVPNTKYGATVYYTCGDGYEVSGLETRVCLDTGEWSGSQSSCTILDCDEAPVIPNGVAITPSGSQVGDLAIYECNTGYGLVGEANVPCEPSGLWGTVPVCRLDCGIPPNVNHSTVVYAYGTLVGANATYTCIDGYRVSGLPTIVCETTGRWANEPFCHIITVDFMAECYVTEQCRTVSATCRDDGNGADRCMCNSGQHYDNSIDTCLADCGLLPDPTNGEIALPEVTAVGQIAVYSCFTGYALDTAAIRTCQENGLWSGTAPKCVTGCPAPDAPPNGQVNTTDGLAAGDTVTYSCNPGYTLVGEESRICLTDSQWNGNAPVCAIECPKLSDIKYGSVDLSQGNWEGAKANYICINNYALVGISTRVCESTGLWSGVQPECVFAIFPDVLLVFGSLFIFLVIIDIFILGFCLYIRYCQQPDRPKRIDNFDELDDKKQREASAFKEEEETGLPPDGFENKVQNKPFPTFPKKPRPLRVAPETRREILPTHPPPATSMGAKIVRMNTEERQLMRRIINPKQQRDNGVDPEGRTTTETGGRPDNTRDKGRPDREGTNDNDHGYNTGASDDNKGGNTSAEDDRLSILSLNVPSPPEQTPRSPGVISTVPRSQSPQRTDRSERNLMEQAGETFRGRAPIPPVTDTPLHMNGDDRPLYNTGERRKLRGTVNTYVPTNRGGPV